MSQLYACTPARAGAVLSPVVRAESRLAVIPPTARNIVTNSGKYAHYGAGGLNRGMHLRSLKECVEAACAGRVPARPPGWLQL